MDASVFVFCGKGGVGKTTVSLSFGLAQARRGRRVVVVSSHPLDELALSVSLEGLGSLSPAAAQNLFVVYIDPRDVLARMVRDEIPSALLARTVLASRLYRSLVEVAPGLKEIAFLARLKELAERRRQDDRSPEFEVLVWDAPATGHFYQTVRVSRSFETYLTGPFARLGRELSSFFSRPARLLLFPVTTLEEMAVEETLELCRKLERDLEVRPAGLLCNMVSPLLRTSDESFQELWEETERRFRDGHELLFVLGRHRIERERFGRLHSQVPAATAGLERVRAWNSDVELLTRVADQLDRLSWKAPWPTF